MTQRIQQGSILGFVLVGALLTALVIGGIFVVRNQLAKNGTQNPGSSQVATDQSDQKNTGTSSNSSNSDSLKQALEQQRAEEKKAQEQKAASEGQSSGTASNNTASTASNLPTTGPADTLWTVLGATALAGVSIAYVRSRALI